MMSAAGSAPRDGNMSSPLTLWAAKKLSRPVKWSCERSEVILADEHGRDNIGEIELAFDTTQILALRLRDREHRRLYRFGPPAPNPSA